MVVSGLRIMETAKFPATDANGAIHRKGRMTPDSSMRTGYPSMDFGILCLRSSLGCCAVGLRRRSSHWMNSWASLRISASRRKWNDYPFMDLKIGRSFVIESGQRGVILNTSPLFTAILWQASRMGSPPCEATNPGSSSTGNVVPFVLISKIHIDKA